MATANVVLLVVIYYSRNWWAQLAALVGYLVLGHLAFSQWSIAPLQAG